MGEFLHIRSFTTEYEEIVVGIDGFLQFSMYNPLNLMTALYKKYVLVLMILFVIVSVLLTYEPKTGNEPAPSSPKIVLQRLGVAFLGEDGHQVMGSGCPGVDGKGEIVDYHLIVSNVDKHKSVERILVTGDHSTLTWEQPCSDDWALSAVDLGNGNWEIFIAPSLPSNVYTVMFFYEDKTFAMGMTIAP